MKHLKDLFLLCLFITIGVTSAWADEATITFASQTSGTSDSNTKYTVETFVNNGITSADAAFGTISCSETTNCYSGKIGYGMKIGQSNNAGNFTISFTALTNVTNIVLNRASFSNSTTATITVKNGETTLASAVSTPSGSADFADMEITNLNIASLSGLTVSTSKYCYIKSITITYTPSSTPSVSLTASSTSIASGESSTLTANATNFSGTVSYQLMSCSTEDGEYENVSADWTNNATTVSPTSTTYYKVKATYSTEEATSSAVCVSVVQKYDITANIPTGGTYTVKIGDADAQTISTEAGAFKAAAGTTITMTSTADDTHKLHSTPFLVNGSNSVKVSKSGDNYSFTMPAEAVTITAQYTETYPITIPTFDHGSVTSDVARTSSGSKVILTVTPENGYQLKANSLVVTKDGTSDIRDLKDEGNNQYSFTMVQPGVTVSAEFEALSFNLTIASSGLSSFCLPFDATIPANTYAYVASAYDNVNSTVTLSKVSGGKIKANEGYIIKGEPSAEVIFTATSESVEAPETNYLVGTTESTDMTSHTTDCYILKSGKFAPVSGGTLAANKAYLDLSGVVGGKELKGAVWEEETGISEVAVSKEQVAGGIFNLAGQKIASPVKGQVYIVNGKKVMY